MDKKIYSAINKIMAEIKPISKGRKNQKQNYMFRGIDDAMNTLSPIMQKHGVFPAIKSAKDISNDEVTSQKGLKGWRTVRRYKIRFYATDGSFIDVISDGEAIDYGDKGSNKAMSVAYREALFKTFIVPFQNDDIENHDHNLKTEQKKQPARLITDIKEQAELSKKENLMCSECGAIIPYKEYVKGDQAGTPNLKCPKDWKHKDFFSREEIHQKATKTSSPF